MEALEAVRTADPIRAPMHRVGSARGVITAPSTLGERITQRRMELALNQGAVAAQVPFFNKKRQEWGILSRSAYCMYERDSVIPDLPVIVAIAKVLQCPPKWLAFGDGERGEVEEVEFDTKAEDGDFKSRRFWALDEDWLRGKFEAEPSELALFSVTDSAPGLSPGDMAIVRKGVSPVNNRGEFVFVYKGEVHIAHVTRPRHGGAFRLYDAEVRSFEEIEPDEMNFLGKVVGKLGAA